MSGVNFSDGNSPVVTESNVRSFIPNDIGQGFANYQDVGTSSVPINLTQDVWIDLPNDGQGFLTNKNFIPVGATDLLNTSNGYLDLSQLQNGDDVLIRTHYEVTPEANNSELNFRLSAGVGLGSYNLTELDRRLDQGAGERYEIVKLRQIAIFDDNTRLNPVKMQVRCSSNATLKNFGSLIIVLRK